MLVKEVGEMTNIQKKFHQHIFKVLSLPTYSFTNIMKILH